MHLPGRARSLQCHYECVRLVSSLPGGRGAGAGTGTANGYEQRQGEGQHHGSTREDRRVGARLRSFGDSRCGTCPRSIDGVGRGGAAAVALQRTRRSRPRARCRRRRRIATAHPARHPRLHRRHSHHHRVVPPGLALRVEAPGRVVLRRSRCGFDDEAPPQLPQPHRHLRRPRAVHACLVRPDPHALPSEGRAGAQARHGARAVGRPAVAGSAAVQSRHLQLRGAGRDDEPPHQPLPLRPRRPRCGPVGDSGRPPVAQHPGALRAVVHGDRRSAHQRLGPQRARGPRAAAAARARRGGPHGAVDPVVGAQSGTRSVLRVHHRRAQPGHDPAPRRRCP